MNKKQFLLLQGWGYAFAIILILILFTTQKIDEFGIAFGIALLFFLSYKSYSCFNEINNTREEDKVYAPAEDSTKSEKIAFYNRALSISIPAFIILSVWTYLDLKNLELGTVEYVSLWGPISLLYDFGGYRLAVISTPLLGVLTMFLLLRKINELKSNE
jgi:hypothetical protein